MISSEGGTLTGRRRASAVPSSATPRPRPSPPAARRRCATSGLDHLDVYQPGTLRPASTTSTTICWPRQQTPARTRIDPAHRHQHPFGLDPALDDRLSGCFDVVLLDYNALQDREPG
ncbi:hypothetical protein ACE0DR_25925 [Azotobacter sp. CWF10]